MIWNILRPRVEHLLGLIPSFLEDDDPRPAREQFNERYAHGGGWQPMSGWSLQGHNIKYPGNPEYKPVAMGKFRSETILVYKHACVCIVQADGSFEVARMD